jgi:hypothetical protein
MQIAQANQERAVEDAATQIRLQVRQNTPLKPGKAALLVINNGGTAAGLTFFPEGFSWEPLNVSQWAHGETRPVEIESPQVSLNTILGLVAHYTDSRNHSHVTSYRLRRDGGSTRLEEVPLSALGSSPASSPSTAPRGGWLRRWWAAVRAAR